MLLRQADAMVSSGMRDAGYSYINLDAGWSAGRDHSGELVPNKGKFPEGMKAFADKIHSKGLKLGIYTAFHISWNHEEQDAQRFANWTVDYVKNDWVYNSHNQDEADAPYRFRLMRDALNRTGRPMFYSIHGKSDTWKNKTNQTVGWSTYYKDAPAIANTWRVAGDIRPSFKSFLSLVNADQGLASLAAPGAFNDIDMLEVGAPSLTEDENK
jgi:alpha-galactosidase